MPRTLPTLSDSDRVLTIPELARESGFGVRFLRDEANAGRLPAIRVTQRGWLRIRVSDWRAYLERHRAQLPAEPAAREHVRRVVEGRLARESAT